MFYLSRWSTSDAAARFARLYAASVTRRYPTAAPLPPPAVGVPSSNACFRWNTSQGLASIETHGTLVLTLEGFDSAVASNLRAIFATLQPNQERTEAADITTVSFPGCGRFHPPPDPSRQRLHAGR